VVDELREDSVACPACGAAALPAPSPARTRCPYCAEEIPTAARVCRFCRSNLEAAEPTPAGPYCEWEDRSLGLFPRYWLTWWNALAHPNSFFARLPRGTGNGAPIRYAVMTNLQLLIPFALLWVLIGAALWVFPIQGAPDWLGAAVIAGIGVYSALIVPLTIMGVYVLAAIYHLSARVCGGEGNFGDTLRVVAYTYGASVLGLVPYVGSVAVLAAHLIMCVYGFKYLHRISVGRSVVVFVLPTAAFVAIVIAAMIGFFVLVFRMR
jgi:hypothetical protein